MQLTESESALLKNWTVKQIQDLSDADPDVLADYVLALVVADDTQDGVRKALLENLEDFLKENTTRFVDNILKAIATKSFDPNAKPLAPTAQSFVPNAFPGSASNLQAPAASSGQLSRKRSFQEDEEMQDADGQRGPGGRGRAFKQMRRGGRGFDQRGGRNAPRFQQGDQSQNQGFPQMPMIDPNDPMGSIMAMQMMGFSLPGMPQLPSMDQQQPRRGQGKRCRDYDNKGFCTRGANCPYEHSSDAVVVGEGSEENDSGHSGQGNFTRGRGRGRGDRGTMRGGRGGRMQGQSYIDKNDPSIVSVAVDKIPEDKFDEQAIRDYFSEFGTIEEITMKQYKKLAIVKYADHDSARRAYDNPKVIFDNRFVKVYLTRDESADQAQNGNDVEMGEEAPQIDMEEFARKQEEAQKVHEEKMKKVQEAQAAREELEAKMKKQAEEREQLLAKLAAKQKGKAPATEGEQTPTADTNGASASGNTEALKAKLAALEQEALSMGIKVPEDSNQPFAARGRGGYRGRGAWNPRGAWRGGRGNYAPRGGAVMRLDNRPKTIAVIFPENKPFDESTDEALKQYLLFNNLMESATIAAHPDRKDAASVAFTERYKAEMFMNAAKEVPHVGTVELSWMANPQPVPSAAPNGSNGAANGDKDSKMEDGQTNAAIAPGATGRAEMDYDVADDDDRWLTG